MVNDADLGEARILIVDDEDANVALLERILRGAGYHDVVATTDPRLVQELFAVLGPDLVLLDLMMPVMDGFEVMRRLQMLVRPGDYRPVLGLTAGVTEETEPAALARGSDGL